MDILLNSGSPNMSNRYCTYVDAANCATYGGYKQENAAQLALNY